MKRITAYIKPHKLAPVTLALHKIEGLTGLSATNSRGFGRGRALEAPHTVRKDLVDFIPNVRIEVVCLNELVDEIVESIRFQAHTGLRGDGKIYVETIDRAVRISTGERGEAAV